MNDPCGISTLFSSYFMCSLEYDVNLVPIVCMFFDFDLNCILI